MPKQYRNPSTSQTLLLPPSLNDWLPEGHFANFVLDVVAELDLSSIETRIQAKDPRGERPYSPRMMVALLFYAYAEGVFSSRRMARGCVENVALRVITGNSQPHFTVIATFRRKYLTELQTLFAQVLRLCREAGLVRGAHVHVDGTRVQANASRHKAMSYDRMKQTEERLTKEIEELLKKAEEADQKEDTEHGPGKDTGDRVDPEVQRRETRRAWIRRVKAALEEEARKARVEELRRKAEEHRQAAEDEPDPEKEKKLRKYAVTADRKGDGIDALQRLPAPVPADELPHHTPPTEPDGMPKPEAQRNFTDPDSRIMKTRKGAYEQAYNGQVVADEATHLILCHGLSNQASDVDHLAAMLERVTNALGHAPETATADAGYFSQSNIAAALHRNIRPYLAVERERRRWPPPKPVEGAPPRGADAKAWMSWMLGTTEGRTRMGRRKSTVELVFGCIKGAMGFRQFLLRGLHKVRGEWALVCTAYNLRKLHMPDLA